MTNSDGVQIIANDMTNTNFIPDEIKKNELRNACHHST
jgi:hypothetical protein